MCVGTEISLPGTDEARNELTLLCKETAKDGVSLLAKETKTGRVVGVAYNKIQVSYTCIKSLITK